MAAFVAAHSRVIKGSPLVSDAAAPGRLVRELRSALRADAFERRVTQPERFYANQEHFSGWGHLAAVVRAVHHRCCKGGDR